MIGNNTYYMPKVVSNYAIGAYIIVLLLISTVRSQYIMPWFGFVWGGVSVVGFFYVAQLLSKRWCGLKDRRFQKKLIWTSIAIRIVYVLLAFWFYFVQTGGTELEFNAADSAFYHDGGKIGAELLQEGLMNFLNNFDRHLGADLSDSGYPFYLSFIYWLTGNSVLLSHIFKGLVDACTVYVVYKFSRRAFDESTGRMIAIFCMLCPQMIYYCGLTLKETEMLFLCMLFIERADAILREGKIVVMPTLFMVLIGLSLFAFRTVLGAVAFLSLFLTMVLSSTKIVKWGKRLLVGFFSVVLLAMMFGSRMNEELQEVIHTDVEAQQKVNMEFRATRNDKQGTANHFAQYVGAAVFAPLIFTIPFPTMINLPRQEGQQMLHGAYYVKNVMSFFTIFALIMLALHGGWRQYVLPLSFMVGYLLILVFSSFAQAGRFHVPIVPIEFMFAGYAIANWRSWKMRRWYKYWMIIIMVACFAWTWFKLAGRGL